MLASKPIDATIATQAARELFKAGLRTPKAVLEADRPTMIDAFGRAHYVRYDESSATRLTDIAGRVHDKYDDDLRGLAGRSEHDVEAAARRLLKQFKGIGETGADIFLREVQDRVDMGPPLLRRTHPGRCRRTRTAHRRRRARRHWRRVRPRNSRRRWSGFRSMPSCGTRYCSE